MPNANPPKLMDKLKEAIDNLTTLTIVTEIDAENNARRMSTTINLIEGDITNKIHRDFVSGDLQALRQFHESQVQKGQEIIKQNIEAIKSIFEFIKDNALDEETGRPGAGSGGS